MRCHFQNTVLKLTFQLSCLLYGFSCHLDEPISFNCLMWDVLQRLFWAPMNSQEKPEAFIPTVPKGDPANHYSEVESLSFHIWAVKWWLCQLTFRLQFLKRFIGPIQVAFNFLTYKMWDSKYCCVTLLFGWQFMWQHKSNTGKCQFTRVSIFASSIFKNFIFMHMDFFLPASMSVCHEGVVPMEPRRHQIPWD